jgi:amino acid transporter
VVWLRYSEEIVSSGGLAAFVEAAAGRRVALAQAAIWSISYFLYLPYTVTDVVYEMLVVIFPGVEPWRWLLQLLLPIGIVAFVLLGTRPVFRAMLVSAVLQLVLLLAFGVMLLAHHGPHTDTFAHGHDLLRTSASISLLFVCGSLPLFLGPEAAGGSRTVRRSLAGAGAIVGAYVVFAAFSLAAVDPALAHAELPGYAMASAYSSRTFAVVIGVGGVISVIGVIVAEYLAFSRLLFAVTGWPVRRLLLWIGVPFIAVDAISLVDPDEFDENLLRPSLVALFLSQLIVFAVYPLYRSRRGRLTALDVVLAVGAFVLMGWGLWRAVTGPVAS